MQCPRRHAAHPPASPSRTYDVCTGCLRRHIDTHLFRLAADDDPPAGIPQMGVLPTPPPPATKTEMCDGDVSWVGTPYSRLRLYVPRPNHRRRQEQIDVPPRSPPTTYSSSTQPAAAADDGWCPTSHNPSPVSLPIPTRPSQWAKTSPRVLGHRLC